MAWLVRVTFTAATVSAVVYLLRTGIPFGALAVVVAAVWLRRTIESTPSPTLVRASGGRRS